MRTSRVARETSRFVNALSPRKALANGNARPTRARAASSTVTLAKGDNSPASSTTPPHSDYEGESSASSLSSSQRKRKRGETSPKTQVKTATRETVITNVSAHTPDNAAKNKPKKAKRQPAKQITASDGSVAVQPPTNWEKVYNLTKEMRSRWPAPVDTMGCESLAEEKVSPRDQRFQTLVALMLSSQTKDTVTSVAIKNLQEKLPGGLNLESILAVEPATLNSLIEKVGFHNNKTKYIKAAAQILVNHHDSDIPDTIEGLIALPGVGPKMAYLCMSAAWDRHEGIGVDVHVHRITNLWGWHKTKTPEETRAALEAWLPKEKWHDINHLLVGFGQTWCPPIPGARQCDTCYLADHGLCPSAVVSKAVKRKGKQETVVKKEEDGMTEVKEDIGVEIVNGDVTAGDVQIGWKVETTADIEDLGKSPRRKSQRLTRS